jgi:hypothetical protein
MAGQLGPQPRPSRKRPSPASGAGRTRRGLVGQPPHAGTHIATETAGTVGQAMASGSGALRRDRQWARPRGALQLAESSPRSTRRRWLRLTARRGTPPDTARRSGPRRLRAVGPSVEPEQSTVRGDDAERVVDTATRARFRFGLRGVGAADGLPVVQPPRAASRRRHCAPRRPRRATSAALVRRRRAPPTSPRTGLDLSIPGRASAPGRGTSLRRTTTDACGRQRSRRRRRGQVIAWRRASSSSMR